MSRSFSESPNGRSPINLPKVFDPFLIGPGHNNHYNSTSIVKLEESGKVFCPLCLDELCLDEITKVEEGLYVQYVENLFEALDQYSETNQLRNIILPILGLILKRRPFKVTRDHEFHHIMQIVHKLMKSEKFVHKEYFSIARMFSVITKNFQTNPVPLKSVWLASQHLLDYGKKQLINYQINSANDLRDDCAKFYESLVIIIEAYLHLLGRFSVEQVSDVIFPLYAKEVLEAQCQRYYKDSQMSCLKFMSDVLIPTCWPHFTKVVDWTQETRSMVGEFFETLRECLTSAIRLKHDEFPLLLNRNDCIQVGHSMIYQNQDFTLKRKIKSFLACFVKYHIENELGSDESTSIVTYSHEVVETNAKNTIKFSQEPEKYDRVTFYLLINFVAIKQNSRYFNDARVKKVIELLDPEATGIPESKVALKAYNYIVAYVILNIGACKHVDKSFTKIWKRYDGQANHENFHDCYLFDEVVFYYVYKHPVFMNLMTSESIKYLLEGSKKRNSLTQNLIQLLADNTYRRLVTKYFTDYELAADILIESMRRDSENNRSPQTFDLHLRSLTNDLGAYLSALLHENVLNSINNESALVENDKLMRLTNIINILLSNSDKFFLEFDDQFIMDLFKLMEKLYEIYLFRDGGVDMIIILNEFITQLMIKHDASLMNILGKLDFAILGYMFHSIADYTKEDRLGESIARLLVTYDAIDYPLTRNISISLSEMAPSVYNWMLSHNKDLHKLSLMVVQRVLDCPESSKTSKAYITASLIHMLYMNPAILENCVNLTIFEAVLKHNELMYNPLLGRILDLLPEKTRCNITECLSGPPEEPPPSPALSFDSSEPHESQSLDDIQINVASVVDQLHEEDGFRFTTSYNLPNYLFASNSVRDSQNMSSDSEDWERIARRHTVK